ncbi:hypothetical protein Rsub_07630 [Raphidocelis subcapitata]|uniref:Uncharacterized protein n=1 Tax=Raphidocelis subcapitata TaxID=307507 RepID=A0A2V0PC47_9CHLO|nr:hypothetical protein Rsub_07630 [Raphidocelis subcapitata]|eukprot:GBF94747.1 hypothetical protein Rsub_07630 [Raphidocelis subcapitata]
MSAKRALRAAREHLAAQQYREAIAECKAALQQDAACFDAYVYIGKAAFLLGDHEQSEAAYQRALKVNDAAPPAWQGLAELYCGAQQWAKAADAYQALVDMAHRGEPAVAGKLPALTRRLAEAHVNCGQLEEAEAVLSELLRAHPSRSSRMLAAAWASAAAAGAGVAQSRGSSAAVTPTAPGAAAAAAAAASALAAAAAGPAAAATAAAAAAVAAASDAAPLDPSERLSLLTMLADIQLREDEAALDARVASKIAARLSEAAGDASKVNEAYERAQALAEAADEGLELECDHASGTLKEIVVATAPTAAYSKYHDAYLHRLRRAVQVAPPGSLARHQRRVAVLELCRAAMEGVCPADACAEGRGCASAYPYETALRYLEIEEEVAGGASAPPSRAMSRTTSGIDLAAAAAAAGGGASTAASPRAGSASAAARSPLMTPPPASFSQPASFFGSLSLQQSTMAQLAGGAGGSPRVGPRGSVGAGDGAAAAASPQPRLAGAASAARLTELVSNPMARCDEPHHADLPPGASRDLAAAAAAQLPPPSLPLTPAASGSLLHFAGGGGGSAAVTPRAPSSLSRHASGEFGSLVHAGGGRGSFTGGGGGAAAVAPLLARDSEAIAQRLVHSFPWNKTGQAHAAMALRRREAYLPSGAATLRLQCGWAGPSTTDLACSRAALDAARHPAARKRRKAGLLKVLTRALAAGAPSTSAAIAAAEIALEEGDAEAALGAAKGGIKFVFQRSRAGNERARHAALMLNLLAAQAMARCGQLEDAHTVFSRLASRVSEGDVAFGSVGLPPTSIRQEAIRGLAHVALKRGDTASALQTYGELVSRAMVGRGTAEHWAFGEYGWLLFETGQAESGRLQIEMALDALARAAPVGAEAAAAEYRWKLGRIYWELGGQLRSDPEFARAQFLEAARDGEGTPWQARAFEWLGRWYAAVARDGARARKCFSRALALDPTLAGAGEGLCALLLGERAPGAEDGGAAASAPAAAEHDGSAADGAGAPASAPASAPAEAAAPQGPERDPQLARRVCEDALAREPLRAGWARARLARLQLEARECAAAAAGFQAAIRAAPRDAALWEGLGAAYQALGRHSSALKSYERALELEPGRLYSLAQAGALLYMAGRYAESAERYRAALSLQPAFPAAQLGLAETLLAAARLHARMGAAGAAADELREAAQAASACARGGRGANMVTAWKLLGDVLIQHAAVTPGGPPAAPAPGEGADAAGAAAAGAARALSTRLVAMRAARRAYLRAVHLEPSSGLLWGDLAGSCHQEATLLNLQPQTEGSSGQGAAAAAAAAAAARAERLARGALRLAPADAWLWRQLGAVSGDPAVSEYALSRALQLDPKDATSWVQLGRLYTRHGEVSLAQRCYEQARGVEPTAVAVWEAMAATSAGLAAPGAERDALDASEHAVGLGGGPESWVGFAAGALRAGRGAEGAVLACAAKSAAQAPLLVAAHNSYGLACEARGAWGDAAAAFRRALALVPAGGADGGAVGAGEPPHTLHLAPGAPGATAAAVPAARGALVAALQLNLARALVRGGRCAEALELYRPLEAAGALAGQPYARICLAFASRGAGEPRAAAASALGAALSEAAEAGPEALMHAVLASLQLAVGEGRLEEGFALLLQYGPELAAALPGGSGPARVTALWLSLLSAAAAAAPAAAGAAEEWEGTLRQWAAGTAGVDGAALEAGLLALRAARDAARGKRRAALRTVAAAVRAAPWLRPLRTRLAAAAMQASPRYAAAAARACPPPTAPETEAAARGDAPSAHAALAAAAAAAPVAAAGPEPPAFFVPGAAALGGAALAGPCIELSVPAAAAARGAGLASATAAAVASEAAAEARRLQALLRVAPGSAGLWALFATVSVQRAAATGDCCHHRAARAACTVAAARAARQLQHASSPAAAAELQCVRARMLAGESESHLHSRLPGCRDAARSSAHAAVEAAAAAQAAAAAAGAGAAAGDAGGPAAAAALAQRQSARVLAAEGRTADAEAAYRRAASLGDGCSQLELARLLSGAGRGDAAAALLGALRGDGDGGGGDDDGDAARPVVGAALEEALLLASLSDLAGARAAAAAALSSAEARSSGGRAAAAAAHAVTAEVALAQGRATLPEFAKNLLLEARHHAGAAAKLALALPGDRGLAAAGTAGALLAAAEVARGRPDRAVEHLTAALAALGEAGGRVPAGVWALAGDVLGDATAWGRAVHTDPAGCRAAWQRLREAAAAGARGGAGGGEGAAATAP